MVDIITVITVPVIIADDELPDYILVMVANKKTNEQIKEDLQLFLTDDTDPFIEW